MSRPIPPEVIFRRLIPGRFTLDEQKIYFGPADSISTGNTELDENLLGFRDTVNSRFMSNVAHVTPPSGMTRIHMEYLQASVKAAMAFYGDDVAFIAITDQLVYRMHQIAEALIRDGGVLEFLGVTLTPERQETLGSALLTVQLQVAETHELGHILHGHCEESALFTPHIDSFGTASNAADKFRAQAMEVDADGYVPHMLLKNLLQGGVGEELVTRLAPVKPIEDFVLSLLTVCSCSLFYLWGQRTFDPSKVYDLEHPPVLARLNVMLTDQKGWCSVHAPHLVGWATPQKFQEIMELLAGIVPNWRGAWDEQSEFLKSAEGQRYYEELYKKRAQLRTEMEGRRWLL